MANKRDAYYRALESSWKRELDNELQVLAVVYESQSIPPKSKTVMTKLSKERIKRCRWNITRAINLRKKSNGT